MKKQSVSNWGNYPKVKSNIKSFSSENDLLKIIQSSDNLIARGLGRCYGDSSLADNIISTLNFNRIIDFNNKEGIITCESGVSLEDLINIFIPKGWFLPVTPGTKFITIGGAIASDIHGKNHHVQGSISNHIISMDVMLHNGDIMSCSKTNNPDLFWATCGGMGLTGVILRATFKLSRIETSFITQESIKAKNLDDIMQIFEESKNFTYSVAWIDCLSKGNKLGRSLMMRGEHATKEDVQNIYPDILSLNKKKKLNIPLNFPSFSLNTLSVKSFNFLYYNKQLKNIQKSLVSYDKFFYPLDGINNWNRIYGKNGFLQYQFVLPKEESYEGLKKILQKISKSGSCSFLAVLKLFGKQENLISFPKEGYTLALDFPVNKKVLKLLEELDNDVLEHGGRLYLTKDARMTKELFMKSYDNAENFKELKHKFDSQNKFQSFQSKRIGI